MDSTSNSEPHPLGWGQETKLVMSVFQPYALEKITRAATENWRFAHYTSAATASLILGKTPSIRLRQASTMNDFREIEFGTQCIHDSWLAHRSQFDAVFGRIGPDFGERLWTWFQSWRHTVRFQTFVTCVSEHSRGEDIYGRLSMWRAYGGANGVALVLRADPFLRASNALRAYSSPVAYHTKETFAVEFGSLINRVEENLAFLQSKGDDWVFQQMCHTLHYAMLCTKHYGFWEEREWRVVQSPAFGEPKNLIRSVEIVNDLPQTVLTLPLKDIPEEGLTGIEIPAFLDRIIIGPTQHPFVIAEAMATLLKANGVEDPASKIAYSDIPLRQ